MNAKPLDYYYWAGGFWVAGVVSNRSFISLDLAGSFTWDCTAPVPSVTSTPPIYLVALGAPESYLFFSALAFLFLLAFDDSFSFSSSELSSEDSSLSSSESVTSESEDDSSLLDFFFLFFLVFFFTSLFFLLGALFYSCWWVAIPVAL